MARPYAEGLARAHVATRGILVDATLVTAKLAELADRVSRIRLHAKASAVENERIREDEGVREDEAR